MILSLGKWEKNNHEINQNPYKRNLVPVLHIEIQVIQDGLCIGIS
ncbi:MAG: hypothetical protein RLY89_1878, partial [Bacteroidota bacterium]